MPTKHHAAGNLPGLREVWAARKRISAYVQETPLFLSAELSKRYNASVYLKLEYLHPTGSFKLRGAANKILSLSKAERSRGVATFSTGNHGLAVAYMAKELGIPVSVFLSSRVPGAKVNNLEALGINVVVHGVSQDEAQEYCLQRAAEEGLTVIMPFDDPAVLAGQGTIGLELLERCPDLDHVIVPVSGGGLAGGIAMALKAGVPGIRVTGVSMEQGAVMYHSVRAGKPVILEEADSLADSLLGGIGLDNKYSFPLVRDFVDEIVLVPEKAIARGMSLLYQRHRIVVEGASATCVAALDQTAVAPGSSVALILSGNNVDTGTFFDIVNSNV
ncbi:MAG: threonine/serine dehydratase [Bacillota bacterium]|nr:threonine/serine dehydratase [Bacillota bacterium]MDW7683156.1 threonine/serine dehydratase [Bacillota bacterium]